MVKFNLKDLLNFKSTLIIGFLLLIGFFLLIGYQLQKELLAVYKNQNSVLIKDREGETLFIMPNQKGYRASYFNEIPPRFKEF
ncbi:MAG: hypothetical protein Q8M00_02315, partial [bacterium]|nr:hypothetical protein [bacterium]